MKKLFHLPAIALLLTLTMNTQPVQAQLINYGVRGGLNIANVGGVDAGETSSRSGFHAGMFFGVSFLGVVAAETGAYYSQKGFSMTYNNTETEVISSYIDVPVLVRFSPLPLLRFFAGPQFSFLTDYREKTPLGTNTSTEGIRDVDLAMVFGAGISLPGPIRMGISYDHGIFTLDEDSRFKVYNRVIKLSVGVRF